MKQLQIKISVNKTSIFLISPGFIDLRLFMEVAAMISWWKVPADVEIF
jgi:hypothetical protein